MSREQSESMVFDTSVLVEMVRGSGPGMELKQSLERRVIVPHLTDANLFELTYLICRQDGRAKASAVVQSLREAGYFDVHDIRGLLDDAARVKCERSLSIIDCITIALGESLKVPVLFARHEKELDAEVKKRAFGVELKFLSDIG